MRLQTQCEMKFDIKIPTPFILMLRLRSGAQQWISKEEYRMTPNIPVYEFADSFGNLCQRLVTPPGPFSIYTSAEVETADYMDEAPGAPFIDIDKLPADVLGYLLPSRYCESDRFCQMATDIVAGELLGYDQVKTIESWLRENIIYAPGTSDVPISAIEVNERKSGVCRDLAHLGIALCRSISIPARLVVGYLYDLEPMDMHAWFEAYVNGRWYTFDATQKELRGGYVAVGYGRDATDVAVYNQFGPEVLPLYQHVQVKKTG